MTRGGSRIFKRGGGAQHIGFFGPPLASKVAQVPKKLMSGRGDSDTFFRSATSVESRASPKRGGGGDPTHFCVPTHFFFFFFFSFKRGGTCTKRGGGQM